MKKTPSPIKYSNPLPAWCLLAVCLLESFFIVYSGQIMNAAKPSAPRLQLLEVEQERCEIV